MEPLQWQSNPFVVEALTAYRASNESYVPELGEAICAMVAGGMSLSEACKRSEIEKSMVASWITTDAGGEFRGKYERAMRAKALLLADEIVEIADDTRDDWETIQTASGNTYTKVNTEAVMRSKLRVETRQKLAKQFLPTLYGDESVGDTESHRVVLHIDTTPIGSPSLPGEPGAMYAEKPDGPVAGTAGDA